MVLRILSRELGDTIDVSTSQIGLRIPNCAPSRSIVCPNGSAVYYPVKRKWVKIKPFLRDSLFREVLQRDMHLFTMGRYGKPFEIGRLPESADPSDWSIEHRGRRPEYWKYVCATACHWVVNFNLRLAMLAEPNRPWRILTSSLHSTVWDGSATLFDMNFLALGGPAEEAFEMATTGENAEELPISTFRATGLPTMEWVGRPEIPQLRAALDQYHRSQQLSFDFTESPELKKCA